MISRKKTFVEVISFLLRKARVVILSEAKDLGIREILRFAQNDNCVKTSLHNGDYFASV